MVSLQTTITPAEEKKKPCMALERRKVVSRKRKLSAKEEEEKGSNLFCKPAKEAREEEGRGVMELNLLGAHPELKSKGRHSKVDPKSLEVGLDLNLELNLSCTPSKMSCLSKEEEEEEEEEERTTEEEIEEMVATVCLRCHMLVMMTKVTLSCPNCKFVHSPDQSSSLALIKPVLAFCAARINNKL